MGFIQCNGSVHNNVSLRNFTIQTDYHTLENTLLLFSTLNAVALAIGLPINIIGICVCRATMTGNAFGHYLKIYLMETILLMLMTYVITCILLTVEDLRIFGFFKPERICSSLWELYILLNMVHPCSLLLLCYCNIGEQHTTTDVDKDEAYSYRWPIVFNTMAVMVSLYLLVLAERRMGIATYHGNYSCIDVVAFPFCPLMNSLDHALIRGYPIFLDGLAVCFLCILLLEIILKKRRLKKHCIVLDVKRGIISHIKEASFQLQPDTKRVIRQVKLTTLNAMLGQRIETTRLRNPRNRAPKRIKLYSQVAKKEQPDNRRRTCCGSTHPHDLEKALAENINGYKNSMTVTLVSSMVIFRVLLDLYVYKLINYYVDWEGFRYNEPYNPTVLMVLMLVHQVGMVLSLPICCLTSQQYRYEVTEWLSSNRRWDLSMDDLDQFVQHLYQSPYQTSVYEPTNKEPDTVESVPWHVCSVPKKT